MDPHKLDVIKAQSKGDLACLKQLCNTWIHSTRDGTWTQVVDALMQCQEPELANKINTIHCSL